MSNTYDQVKQRKLLYKNPTSESDILGAFANDEEWLSRAQLAGRVFRSVTPKIIDLIEGMVTKGLLVRSTEPLPNGYKKFWYRRQHKGLEK